MQSKKKEQKSGLMRNVMKSAGKIILLVGVIGLFFISGCSDNPFSAETTATADLSITDKEQHVLSTTEPGYSADKTNYSSVTAYYKIKNTGAVKIKSYEIWIKVKCKDDTNYTNSITGGGILAGKEVTGYTTISTAGKEYDSVEVDTYELKD